jgi:hypothetical protein
MPFTTFGATIACYTSFTILINDNYLLAGAYKVDPTRKTWDNIIDDILEQITFWVVLYLGEKIVVIYIAVHYHYRSDRKRNMKSKEIHVALATLYSVSISTYPLNSPHFVVEDTIIRNPNSKVTLGESSSEDVERFLRRIGYGKIRTAAFLGNFKNENESHWLAHGSAYAVVERALGNPKSAAALATRLWKSFVAKDEDVLRVEDVTETLGPYRQNVALEIFKTLNESESREIRLEEMVWTVVEAGRVRQAIYKSMADMNDCMNTLEWINLLFIALVMTFFILVSCKCFRVRPASDY